jgi:hypothetical protein
MSAARRPLESLSRLSRSSSVLFQRSAQDAVELGRQRGVRLCDRRRLAVQDRVEHDR